MMRLEFERRRKHLTLKQVANAAGCSPGLVSLIERGQRTLTETTGRKIAKALGLESAEWENLKRRA